MLGYSRQHNSPFSYEKKTEMALIGAENITPLLISPAGRRIRCDDVQEGSGLEEESKTANQLREKYPIQGLVNSGANEKVPLMPPPGGNMETMGLFKKRGAKLLKA